MVDTRKGNRVPVEHPLSFDVVLFYALSTLSPKFLTLTGSPVFLGFVSTTMSRSIVAQDSILVFDRYCSSLANLESWATSVLSSDGDIVESGIVGEFRKAGDNG